MGGTCSTILVLGCTLILCRGRPANKGEYICCSGSATTLTQDDCAVMKNSTLGCYLDGYDHVYRPCGAGFCHDASPETNLQIFRKCTHYCNEFVDKFCKNSTVPCTQGQLIPTINNAKNTPELHSVARDTTTRPPKIRSYTTEALGDLYGNVSEKELDGAPNLAQDVVIYIAVLVIILLAAVIIICRQLQAEERQNMTEGSSIAEETRLIK